MILSSLQCTHAHSQSRYSQTITSAKRQGDFLCLLINVPAPSAARSSHPTKSIKSPDVPRYCFPRPMQFIADAKCLIIRHLCIPQLIFQIVLPYSTRNGIHTEYRDHTVGLFGKPDSFTRDRSNDLSFPNQIRLVTRLGNTWSGAENCPLYGPAVRQALRKDRRYDSPVPVHKPPPMPYLCHL